jgi:flavodoxin
MKTCVLYFSRTGNTKRLAQAIAESTNATVFDVSSSEPSVAKDFDLLILGTPTEGFSPAKETVTFVQSMPKVENKKAILFCTHSIAKGSTFKTLEKQLAIKGYKTILSVSKRGMKPDTPADFSDVLKGIKKALEKL